MRFKHVWTYMPLPTYVKTFWERVTFTRLTVIYLTFSVLHFLVQLALQIRAFTVNAHAFQVGINLVQQANPAIDGLPFYSNSILHICQWVPANLDLDGGSCKVVWPNPHVHGQEDNIPSPYYSSPSSAGPLLPSNLPPTISTTAIPALTSISLIFETVNGVVVTSSAPGTIVTSQETASSPATSSQIIQSSVTSQTSSLASSQVPSAGTTIFTNAPLPPLTTDFTPPSVPITTQSPPPAVTSGINNGVVSSGSGGNSGEGAGNDGGVGSVSGTDSNDDAESDDENDGENDDDGDNAALTVTTLGILRRDHSGIPSASSEINSVCLDALSYPLSILGNTKREDIVFMAFQFWVLGMSIVALLNESIPHIFASLVTHVMATAWGGFQLSNTASFRSQFNTLITKGACAGVPTGLPISPAYWETRRAAEVSSLTLNALALLVSCFLSWRLFKLFGWQTFKRVGASLVVNRMYKLVLILSIAIQLSLFFIAVAVSLWLDRLINNVIGDLADFRKLYMASCIIILVLLIPWLMMGWFGVRRELRISMLMFLILCVTYLGGWGLMFVSTTFRWTFITWSFFAMIATISVVLTVTCLILGLLCRMNFGKGLLRYLHAPMALPGGNFGIVTPEMQDYRHDDEKVDFPSTEAPMPTFNAAYGHDFPAHGQAFISNGPRFFTQSLQPNMAVIVPQEALTRTPSNRSTDSYSSEKSYTSWGSQYDVPHSRSNSGHNGQFKRWVIE